jgi:hypothetical protein
VEPPFRAELEIAEAFLVRHVRSLHHSTGGTFDTTRRRRVRAIPAAIAAPPATCTHVISSDRIASAKTAARNG